MCAQNRFAKSPCRATPGTLPGLLFFFALWFNFPLLFAQDTLGYYTQALELIEGKQYASAHLLLQEGLQQVGLEPHLVCLMVENALTHYRAHDGFKVFILQDEPAQSSRKKTARTKKNASPVAVYYPDQLLKRLLEKEPDFARAHKLLGDFYRMQLPEEVLPRFVNQHELVRFREQVLKKYLKAVQLGLDDVDVNRWLGNYYLELNQVQQAREFFQRNLEPEVRDWWSAFKVAQLAFQDKEFSEAFNYAVMALERLPADLILERYQATRLAAQSLLGLGEVASFRDQVSHCIQILPSRQEAYLDLLNYLLEQELFQEIPPLVQQMLLNNPYERPGYEFLETFSLQQGDFQFANTLLDEILIKYDYSDLVMGHVYWTKGNLTYRQGKLNEARKLWEISKSYFSKIQPEDSLLFRQIGLVEEGKLN